VIHKKIGKYIDKAKKVIKGGNPKDLFSEDSVGGQQIANEDRKNDIQNRIRDEINPTRQNTPPQYGRSKQSMDKEGNQDTLE